MLEKEFENCITLIQKDNIIHNKLNRRLIVMESLVNEVTPIVLLKYILEIMVTDYIITKKIDEVKLLILYKDMKDFFYQEYLDIVTIAPLHNFDSDGSELISISSQLTIRKIDLKDKIAFFYNRKILDKLFPYDTKWVLEHKTSIKDNLQNTSHIEFPDHDLVESSFAAVITLLRLLDFGIFGTNTYIRYVPLNIPIQPLPISSLKISGFDSIFDNGQYIFKSGKLNKFRVVARIWRNFD